MISGLKEFGQYKPLKYKYDESEFSKSDDVSYCSTCAIPNKWTELQLLEITPYNKDTSIFKFGLPGGHEKLNLPVFSFILVRAPGRERDGTDAVRPYTSISDDSATDIASCVSKVSSSYPLIGVTLFNLLCVGAGVAPMLHVIRKLLTE
eukprot:gene42036-55781_t